MRYPIKIVRLDIDPGAQTLSAWRWTATPRTPVHRETPPTPTRLAHPPTLPATCRGAPMKHVALSAALAGVPSADPRFRAGQPITLEIPALGASAAAGSAGGW